MFDTAKAAKLQPHDIAKLLQISRVTVSAWYNGHSNPHRLLADRVAKLLDGIATAVNNGSLPVPHDVPRRERSHYLKTTLAPYLSKVVD